MSVSDALKSATPTTPGFCLECKSDLQLSREGSYYVCLCGSESTSSFYLPFGWVLNKSYAADIPHKGCQPPIQLVKASSATQA